MKTKMKFAYGNLVEIVTPFGEGADEWGLFDDCPQCQELRAKLQSGEVVKAPFPEMEMEAEAEPEPAKKSWRERMGFQH